MEYYRDRGFDYMELGHQQFGSQVFDHPSQKDMTISLFKRGFGGTTFPLFRGIKYYDNGLLGRELRKNVEALTREVDDGK